MKRSRHKRDEVAEEKKVTEIAEAVADNEFKITSPSSSPKQPTKKIARLPSAEPVAITEGAAPENTPREPEDETKFIAPEPKSSITELLYNGSDDEEDDCANLPKTLKKCSQEYLSLSSQPLVTTLFSKPNAGGLVSTPAFSRTPAYNDLTILLNGLKLSP